MFSNLCVILVSGILYKFVNLHPIVQPSVNCCQNQQVCTQGIPTALAPVANCCVPSSRNQQPCAPCPTAFNCGQCQTSCAACPIAFNCGQCQKPYAPCPTTVNCGQCSTSCAPCPTINNCGQCQTSCAECQTAVIQTFSTSSCCQCHQPCPASTTSLPPPLPPPTPAPLPSPSPSPCPENTIKINNTCQPVFCGTGIYINGKCIWTKCPRGTVWTGTQCEFPKPHEHTNITIINKVYTKLNYATNHTMNLNNTVNIFMPELPRPNQCCVVVTPHTCVWDDSEYDCRSRSYRTCSSVCSASYIHLRPPSFMQIPLSCERNDWCNDHKSFYPDCSNCYDGGHDCGTYCQKRSICQERSCLSVDLRTYCRNYPSSMGCRQIDGCAGDWCDT